MRHDLRPYALKALQARLETAWVDHFVNPRLEHMGTPGMIMKPWYLKIYGSNISFGDAVHVITSRDRTVRLTTWRQEREGGTLAGRIEIGDYALLCPAVRIDSASGVTIGANTMLAAGAYLTDADWHDLYDRTQPIGATVPIVLADNVWIGDGAMVCKGVHIGENTIVGARSVVTKSLPANVIAAGNPASVVRELDPDIPLRRRVDLLGDPEKMRWFDTVEREMRKDNTWRAWLRATLAPRRED